MYAITSLTPLMPFAALTADKWYYRLPSAILFVNLLEPRNSLGSLGTKKNRILVTCNTVALAPVVVPSLKKQLMQLITRVVHPHICFV